MKKFITFALCLSLALTFVGCSDKKQTEETPVVEAPAETPSEQPKTDNEIVVNIKPLEEVDAETLGACASALGFENAGLFHAFANAIGKTPSEVTQQDVEKVHYVAVGPENDGSDALYIGYIDYVDLCLSEAATEETVIAQLNEIVMMSELKLENKDLSDLGNFKNVEMFEIYNVEIQNVSFITNYETLIFGYFKSNGITDVSSLKDYNPESLVELDFTDNDVDDWSPLEHIKEKVLVFYDMNTGVSINLDSYLEQRSEAEQPVVTPEQNDSEETIVDSEGFELVDENGNPADFSSLFD